MHLLVDIGNSSIFMGLEENKKIIRTYRVNSDTSKSSDEYLITLFPLLNKYKVEDALICSVVPILTGVMKKCIVTLYNIEPKIMGFGMKTGLNIKTDDPKQVGSDLIAVSVAASKIYPECLVLDLGTASKFLYVSNNSLLGVVIAPGVAVSTKAMISHAALLPNIELVPPKKVLNTSTIPCMQSGIIYGFSSMIDGMIYRIKKELNKNELKVIATGGLSELICPNCLTNIEVYNKLILDGLIEIYYKNLK